MGLSVTLRLSEHYVSIQGEGPRVGALTQFVRFAGCNMRCPGWPCDTQHAIDPNIWRRESEKVEGEELAKRIYDKAQETGAYNICFTGGEPFLQPQNELFMLVDPLATESYGDFSFEVFTNGSFPFPNWTKDPMVDMLYNMDWKLVGSGESQTALEVREQNARFLGPNDCIKFVINSDDDLWYALGTSKHLVRDGFTGKFYIGRAWNSPVSNEELVDFMIKHKLAGWYLNVQIHKYIYEPDKRGV